MVEFVDGAGATLAFVPLDKIEFLPRSGDFVTLMTRDGGRREVVKVTHIYSRSENELVEQVAYLVKILVEVRPVTS